MKTPIALTLALALMAGPGIARADGPPESREDCPPGTPGYLCVSPKLLWESGVRWRNRAQACWENLADERADLGASKEKLAVRTGTTAVTIPSAEGGGVDPWLVVTIGVAALLGGIVVGVVASGDKDTQVLILDRLDDLLQ